MAKTRVKSLARLRQQNKNLKEKIEAESELVKLEEERIRLGIQNKRLLGQLNRSSSGKAVGRTLRNIGRGAFIVGKSIGKGLIRYGRFLDQKDKVTRRRVRTLKRKR